MIKNPDEPYVGPRGMTKREFITLEFVKLYVREHGLRAALWHAKQSANRMIGFDDELKMEEEKRKLTTDEDDDDDS